MCARLQHRIAAAALSLISLACHCALVHGLIANQPLDLGAGLSEAYFTNFTHAEHAAAVQFDYGSKVFANADMKSEDCPYRRPWDIDTTWTSAIESHQNRPCTDAWIMVSVDQGGFGADLHVWTANLAAALEAGKPIVTQASLSKPGVSQYPFGNSSGCHIINDDGGIGCFFDDRARCDSGYNFQLNPQGDIYRMPLDQMKLPPNFNGSISDWRREAVTFLFMRARPWLLDHACSERSRMEFEVPDITLHIRWGDKWKEMRLVPMQYYIDKIHHVVTTFSYPPDVKIFVMTEDYRALDAFRALADPRWKVQVYAPALFPRSIDLHADSPRAVSATGHDVSTSSLVAMFMCLEAKHYIGATGSNWARLMNELRQSRNMYSPTRLGGTHFHDLQFASNGAGPEMDGHPSMAFEW